jgi:hypothetical protein
MMRARKNPAAVSLGRKGGRVTSAAKARAVRLNGAKGGRPPKFAPGDRVVGLSVAPSAQRGRAGTITGRTSRRAEFLVQFDHEPGNPTPAYSWWLKKGR